VSLGQNYSHSAPFEVSDLEDEIELPSDNDLLVLKAIGEDEDTKDVSFQGIKRKLGLHQETLSRALHRLQRDGYVERLEHAYRISPKGLNTISHRPERISGPRVELLDPYSVSLLQAKLPEDVSLSALVQSLSFKWFGNLRWLGSNQTPDSATLSWITNDTGQKISVRIKEDALTIETSPSGREMLSAATRAAFELFDHVSKALKGVESSRSPDMSAKAA